jgi:predicted aldo/keto reductase-like oxidoreductase
MTRKEPKTHKRTPVDFDDNVRTNDEEWEKAEEVRRKIKESLRSGDIVQLKDAYSVWSDKIEEDIESMFEERLEGYDEDFRNKFIIAVAKSIAEKFGDELEDESSPAEIIPFRKE